MLNSRISRIISCASTRILAIRTRSSVTTDETSVEEVSKLQKPTKPAGFHQAFLKYTQLDQAETTKDDVPFSTLMRNSKLVDLGDPNGRVITGTIFHIINDDLYIDFGGKFHCVCTRPSKNGHSYIRGSVVKLRLKELELSTKFLGSDRDLSLLEADAVLVGLVSTPRKER